MYKLFYGIKYNLICKIFSLVSIKIIINNWLKYIQTQFLIKKTLYDCKRSLY